MAEGPWLSRPLVRVLDGVNEFGLTLQVTRGSRDEHHSFRSRFTERNCAFKLAGRIQNANFARAEARAASRIVDRILLIQEHRLDTGRLGNIW